MYSLRCGRCFASENSTDLFPCPGCQTHFYCSDRCNHLSRSHVCSPSPSLLFPPNPTPAMTALDSAELTLRSIEGCYSSFLDFKVTKKQVFPSGVANTNEENKREEYPETSPLSPTPNPDVLPQFFFLPSMPESFVPRRSEHEFFNQGSTLLTRVVNLRPPVSPSILPAPTSLRGNPAFLLKMSEFIYRLYVGSDEVNVYMPLETREEVRFWNTIGVTRETPGGEVVGEMEQRNKVVMRLHMTVKRAMRDIAEGGGSIWMGRGREPDVFPKFTK
ncbi:hypothetical protein TrST_g1285 [Triparma strigata]|uniref:Uncharacterized protein n=1 Tax=Triparma strigata TaxID=1606541 RepID=A0A9W7DWM8_9STRA|nr:hypothetical protein TrST_g1285 [Triparma strigata]